jgi:hypothetical protein
MPTQNPRINITFEPHWQQLIAGLAKVEGKSISAVAKDLVLEALELREDVELSKIANARKKTGSKRVSHKRAWTSIADE